MPILLVPGDYPRSGELSPGYSQDGVYETTLGDLLSMSFGAEDLELPREKR
jgi:cytidine deaminase